MIRQAIIPLAGLGTRLLPLTSVFAKELLPMNGKPNIEYILDECMACARRLIDTSRGRIRNRVYFVRPHNLLRKFIF